MTRGIFLHNMVRIISYECSFYYRKLQKRYSQWVVYCLEFPYYYPYIKRHCSAFKSKYFYRLCLSLSNVSAKSTTNTGQFRRTLWLLTTLYHRCTQSIGQCPWEWFSWIALWHTSLFYTSGWYLTAASRKSIGMVFAHGISNVSHPWKASITKYPPIEVRHGNKATDARGSLLSTLMHTPVIAIVRRQRDWLYVNAMSITCKQEVTVDFLRCLPPLPPRSPKFFGVFIRIDNSPSLVAYKFPSFIF